MQAAARTNALADALHEALQALLPTADDAGLTARLPPGLHGVAAVDVEPVPALSRGVIKAMLLQDDRNTAATAGTARRNHPAAHAAALATPPPVAGASSAVGPVLRRPYVRALAASLLHASRTGGFPTPPLPRNEALLRLRLGEPETDRRKWLAVAATLVPRMTGDTPDVEVARTAREVLVALGDRGVRLALGLQHTR